MQTQGAAVASTEVPEEGPVALAQGVRASYQSSGGCGASTHPRGDRTGGEGELLVQWWMWCVNSAEVVKWAAIVACGR